VYVCGTCAVKYINVSNLSQATNTVNRVTYPTRWSIQIPVSLVTVQFYEQTTN